MQITVREPGSALTHSIAMIMALIAAAPLLEKTALSSSGRSMLAMCIFIGSMVLLYAASTTYHSVNVSGNRLELFKKIDHMMVFVLIAGTYTPVCMIILSGRIGFTLLTVVWGIALLGILIKAFWINCPKWFSSITYISMGWVCIFVIGQLWSSLPHAAFGWLLGGGILYTIGGIIYALKLSIFNEKHKFFGSHEIFHLFVMGGSVCHFILMYVFVA